MFVFAHAVCEIPVHMILCLLHESLKIWEAWGDTHRVDCLEACMSTLYAFHSEKYPQGIQLCPITVVHLHFHALTRKGFKSQALSYPGDA